MVAWLEMNNKQIGNETNNLEEEGERGGRKRELEKQTNMKKNEKKKKFTNIFLVVFVWI